MLEQVDLDHCRAALRAGSSTFRAASWLLPPAVVRPVTALYAFCRTADDAIDAADGDATTVAWLARRLDAIYDGSPEDHPEDRLLADVVVEHALPRKLFDALLEGFQWDANGRRYSDVAELEDYAARVAGSVGVAMALIMGARSRTQLARAADLGTAMQLTNICRDVGEDARNGRVYLPLDELAREGVDLDTWLGAPDACDGVRRIVARLLARADVHYRRATSGIARLAPAHRHSIFAAALIYRDIGRVIAERAYDSVSDRAYVDGRRKGVLLLRSLARVPRDESARRAEPLPATEFLVRAAARSSREHELESPVGRGLELLLRLERRRAAASAAVPLIPDR